VLQRQLLYAARMPARAVRRRQQRLLRHDGLRLLQTDLWESELRNLERWLWGVNQLWNLLGHWKSRLRV
jgi:hypothetical protein